MVRRFMTLTKQELLNLLNMDLSSETVALMTLKTIRERNKKQFQEIKEQLRQEQE